MPPDLTYSVRNFAGTESNLFQKITIDVQLSDLADGYLRIVTDECLVGLQINDKAVDELPIPYCDSDRGRSMSLGQYLLPGNNVFILTLRGTKNKISARLLPEGSPWKGLFSMGSIYLSVLLLVLVLTKKLPLMLKGARGRVYKRIVVVLFALVSTGIFIFAPWIHGDTSSLFVRLCLTALSLLFAELWYEWPALPMNPLAPPKVKEARVLLLLVTGLYIFFVSLGTINRNYALHSYAYDLGIQENLFWNMAHGDIFLSSVMGNISYLGNHTSLIYLLLAPIYIAFPTTETLLVAQAALVGAAAIPLFLWSSSKLRSEWLGFLIASGYLLSPAIQGANFFEFHELCFCPLLLFSSILFHDKRKHALEALTILLLLIVKEDTSIVVVLLGGFFLLNGEIRFGLRYIFAGACSLFFFQGLVIPLFAGGNHSYIHYFSGSFPKAHTLNDLFAQLVVNPFAHASSLWSSDRGEYLSKILAPYLFTPLITPPGMMLSLYGLGLAIFGSQKALYLFGFQYVFHFIPLLIIATVTAVSGFERTVFRPYPKEFFVIASTGMSIVLFVIYGMFHPLLEFSVGYSSERVQISKSVDDSDRQCVAELSRDIPNMAFVEAGEVIVPQLSRRKRIMPIYRSAPSLVEIADYLIVDDPEAHQPFVTDLLNQGLFVTTEKKGRFLLLTKTLHHPQNTP